MYYFNKLDCKNICWITEREIKFQTRLLICKEEMLGFLYKAIFSLKESLFHLCSIATYLRVRHELERDKPFSSKHFKSIH